MPTPSYPEDDTGSLERARERLYKIETEPSSHIPTTVTHKNSVQHKWKEDEIPHTIKKRRISFAGIFFIFAFLFFFVSLGIAGYFFLYGGNSVSVDKISVDVLGPSTIAGGDAVPLSLTITNKNATAIEDATIQITFPSGTRSADNVLSAYPRYTENLGTIASGMSVTRSVKAVVFGGTGQAIMLPISLSYSTADSNAVFVKKTSFQLAVSSTPLSVSVDAPVEVTSGNPFTFVLTVRSNATVPMNNVVLSGSFPFGFSPISSSPALSNSSFLLGTVNPGTSKSITLTGTLQGQDNEQRVFHFTLGTSNSAQDQALAVTYMTQDSTVSIMPHFIDTTLALNGNTAANVVTVAGTLQNATASYSNKLSTSIQNAVVSIAISGSGIDHNSIKTSNGFYRSSDHTIIFSRDTDPSLATLAPGASGVGTFTFLTLPLSALSSSPSINFSISASGTRMGETNVLEQISTSVTKTVKIVTAVTLSNSALHTSGPFSNSGPIPPRAGQDTTYTVVWRVQNQGSPVAGGVVTTILPSYISYTGKTSGDGSFSYDSTSHTVTWNCGDLTQNGNAQGVFQVAITPSTSQKGDAPALTGKASFSGYDRFAGVNVSATANPATTATVGDSGYTDGNAIVQ